MSPGDNIDIITFGCRLNAVESAVMLTNRSRSIITRPCCIWCS